MSNYKTLLESIMIRSSEALGYLSANNLSEFSTAVGDIESDINSLLAQVNKDDAIIAVLEAEAQVKP